MARRSLLCLATACEHQMQNIGWNETQRIGENECSVINMVAPLTFSLMFWLLCWQVCAFSFSLHFWEKKKSSYLCSLSVWNYRPFGSRLMPALVLIRLKRKRQDTQRAGPHGRWEFCNKTAWICSVLFKPIGHLFLMGKWISGLQIKSQRLNWWVSTL